jgi:hypothetical protein
MLAVDLGHRYSELQCAVCHQPLKRCDRVLTSYRHGQPRVMHAHACVAARAHASAIVAQGDHTGPFAHVA